VVNQEPEGQFALFNAQCPIFNFRFRQTAT
jgi:hypothetical protein